MTPEEGERIIEQAYFIRNIIIIIIIVITGVVYFILSQN